MQNTQALQRLLACTKETKSAFHVCLEEGSTWTPKVCKIMAFMAIIMGLGPLFYLLLGFR